MVRKEKKLVRGHLFQKTNTRSNYKPADEGGGEEGEELASKVTLSYQSKREVVAETRDTRATVDIDTEADIRVRTSVGRGCHVTSCVCVFVIGEERGEVEVSEGCGLW